MPRQIITSFQNNKIKLANQLVSKRQRDKTGLFIIDYARDLQRAMNCGYKVEFAFYCDELANEDDQNIGQMIDETKTYYVSQALMAKASYRQNPGGLVAVMQQKPNLTVSDFDETNTGHILGLVDLKKPGNIGALLRTADAAGIATVCLIDTQLDLYNPNIIRSSTGACFSGNIYFMSSQEGLEIFQANAIRIFAAHLQGSISLFNFDFRQQQTAILLGAEDTGLEDIWVKNCDVLVKIPMIGKLSDSLNVSVSGAIVMYEALRQQSTLA